MLLKRKSQAAGQGLSARSSIYLAHTGRLRETEVSPDGLVSLSAYTSGNGGRNDSIN